MLDGATERRLASDLTEVIADPLFDRMRPEPQAIDGLVGRYPALARAVVTLHRAFLDRSQAMHTLADRLNQDSFLGEAIHRRPEEHTSELQSLMRNSYAGFCLK